MAKSGVVNDTSHVLLPSHCEQLLARLFVAPIGEDDVSSLRQLSDHIKFDAGKTHCFGSPAGLFTTASVWGSKTFQLELWHLARHQRLRASG